MLVHPQATFGSSPMRRWRRAKYRLEAYASTLLGGIRVSSRFYQRQIAVVEASALFAPQSVKIDDNDNQDAGDDTLPECIYVQQIGAVVDRRQDEGTEQRPVHRA